jgi:uncharacterized Zn-finger protein
MSELSLFLDSISLEDTRTTAHEDIYHLLLHKQQQSPPHVARDIPLPTPPSPPPVHTIDPQQLGSSTYTSASGSSSSSTRIPQDSASVSSLEDDEDTVTTEVKKTPRMSWAMNDEFHQAIQTWLNQNEKQQTVKFTKRNSVSEASTAIRTSITKRRKSDSSVAFMRPALSNPLIPSASQPSTKSSTPSSLNPTEEEDTDEKPFKCDSCVKAFRRSEHLKRHIRSVHSNIRPFPCKFCDKKFSRSDNLAQHLRTHNKH